MTQFLAKSLSWRMVLCVGFIMTIVMALRIYNSEKETEFIAFKKETQEQSKILQEFMGDSFHVLDSLDAYFYSSKKVERSQFGHFSQHFFNNYPYIHSIEWVPRLIGDQRSSYEMYAKQDGLNDFKFTELDASGQFVAASLRQEYFPIFYAEPINGNEQVLGFDLGSEPQRLKLLQDAQRIKQIVISPVIKLLQDKNEQKDGLLIIKPLYKREESVQSRVDSFVLVVMRVSRIFEKAFKHEQSHQIALKVFDVTESGQRNFIYSYGKESMAGVIPWSTMKTQETIYIANRRWEVIAQPQCGFVIKHHLGALLVFLLGLIFTVTLAVIIYTQRKRQEDVEQKIEQRTAQLKEANERLRSEIGLRNQVEEISKSKFSTLELMNQSVATAADLDLQSDIVKHSMEVLSCLKPGTTAFARKVIFDGQAYHLSSEFWHCGQIERFSEYLHSMMSSQNLDADSAEFRVITQRKLWWLDLETDKFALYKDLASSVGVKSLLIVPIVVFDEVVYVMEFLSCDKFPFDFEVLQMIESFIAQIGRIIERKESQRKLREEKERLQLFQNVTVSREMEIIELKKNNNELHRRLGLVPPYDLSFLEKTLGYSQKLQAGDEYGPTI